MHFVQDMNGCPRPCFVLNDAGINLLNTYTDVCYLSIYFEIDKQLSNFYFTEIYLLASRPEFKLSYKKKEKKFNVNFHH